MKYQLPSHVAIIMDGNRRWSKEHGLPPIEGHKKGVDALIKIVEVAAEFRIKNLTVYALSTENFRQRPKSEVAALLRLIKSGFTRHLVRLKNEGIRVNVFGDTEELPISTQLVMKSGVKELSSGNRVTVNVAINYGSRSEILKAAKKLAEKHKPFTEAEFEKQLYTAGIPDPDLLIRTGGSRRISNFLLWQLSYSELYFTDTLWPDFDEGEFKKALEYFHFAKRNFGR